MLSLLTRLYDHFSFGPVPAPSGEASWVEQRDAAAVHFLATDDAKREQSGWVDEGSEFVAVKEVVDAVQRVVVARVLAAGTGA